MHITYIIVFDLIIRVIFGEQQKSRILPLAVFSNLLFSSLLLHPLVDSHIPLNTCLQTQCLHYCVNEMFHMHTQQQEKSFYVMIICRP